MGWTGRHGPMSPRPLCPYTFPLNPSQNSNMFWFQMGRVNSKEWDHMIAQRASNYMNKGDGG